MPGHKKLTDDKSTGLSIREHASVISDVLFFSMGEGAIVVDERGNISRINKIALDILGFKEDELLGKWFPEALVAEKEDGTIIPNIDRPVTETMLSAKPIFERLYYRRKDGSRIPVALTVSPVIHDDKPIGAIELFRDITDEVRLEHAKDEFISIASHQLRTPASVVKQYLGMILEGYVPPGDQQLEMLKIAYDHNNNQLEIINDLLNAAQAEANQLKPGTQEVEVIGLLNKIIHSQKPDFEENNTSLCLQTDHEEVVASADPLHLQMVFENLLNNANKYSPPGTKVNVCLAASDNNITVKIVDQGIGIDKQDFPKLFNKFSRIDNVSSTASGTGLGLYWAKKLVELYNGSITISSKLNKGTTFTVKLPRESIA